MSRYFKRDRKIENPDQISRDSTKDRIEMFFCLVPVFGLIPAVIALVRQRSSRKVRDVSQVAIAMMLIWAIAYGAMGGVPVEGAALQTTAELIKASFSSGYFAFCMYLMYRLYRHQEIALPRLTDDQKSSKDDELRSQKRK
jgi:bacteriorhodopsin